MVVMAAEETQGFIGLVQPLTATMAVCGHGERMHDFVNVTRVVLGNCLSC